MEKFRLSENEGRFLNSYCEHQHRCWICSMFYRNVKQDEEGYFLPANVFLDDGITYHLEQLLEKKIFLPFETEIEAFLDRDRSKQNGD